MLGRVEGGGCKRSWICLIGVSYYRYFQFFFCSFSSAFNVEKKCEDCQAYNQECGPAVNKDCCGSFMCFGVNTDAPGVCQVSEILWIINYQDREMVWTGKRGGG